MKKKFFVMLSALMLMAVPSLSLAASMAGSNTVNSAAIIDGAVSTADIANQAVTSAKIANGAVTAAKLGIVCTAGQTLSYTSTGWVCSAGTAGPAGPAGPQGATGATGATGPQGTTPKYANVVIVAKSGGDFTDPVAAMNSITDSTSANPYLLKIMPGEYAIGSTKLIMKSYVDIEGSGQNCTRIWGDGNSYASSNGGVVEGASNAQLSNITIENRNGYWTPAALYNNAASPIIINVTLISTGSPTGNYGIKNLFSSSPILNNVTIYAAGRISYGIMNGWNSNPVLNTVNITAYSDPRFAQNDVAGGMSNSGSSPKLNNVTIIAYGGNTNNIGIINASDETANSTPIIVNSNISATDAIYSPGSSIFNSIITGTITSGTKCVNVIDSSFNQINCQP